MKTTIRRSNLKTTAARQRQRQRRRERSVRRGQNSELEFTARLNELESVEFIVAAAKDVSLPVRLRRACAVAVIKLARGSKKSWHVDPATINLAAPGKSGFFGATIGDELAAVEITRHLLQEVTRLIDAGIQPAQWPSETLNRVLGLVQFYEQTEV
jgi:hypothetical protein